MSVSRGLNIIAVSKIPNEQNIAGLQSDAFLFVKESENWQLFHMASKQGKKVLQEMDINADKQLKVVLSSSKSPENLSKDPDKLRELSDALVKIQKNEVQAKLHLNEFLRVMQVFHKNMTEFVSTMQHEKSKSKWSSYPELASFVDVAKELSHNPFPTGEEEDSTRDFSEELWEKEQMISQVMKGEDFGKTLQYMQDAITKYTKFSANAGLVDILKSIKMKKLDSGGVMSANDVAIMPIQIIPRFELLLKDILVDIEKLKAVKYIHEVDETNKIGSGFADRLSFIKETVQKKNSEMNVEYESQKIERENENKLITAEVMGIFAKRIRGTKKDAPQLTSIGNKLFSAEMSETVGSVIAKSSSKEGLSANLVAQNFYKTFIYTYVNALLRQKQDEGSLNAVRDFLRSVDGDVNEINASGLVFNSHTPYDKDYDKDHAHLDERVLSSVSSTELEKLVEYIFNKVLTYVSKAKENEADKAKFVEAVLVINQMGPNAKNFWDKMFKAVFPNFIAIIGQTREKLSETYGLLLKQPKSVAGHHSKLLDIIDKDFRAYMKQTGKSNEDIDIVVDDLRDTKDLALLKNKIKEFLIWNEMREYISGRFFSVVGTAKKEGLSHLETLVVDLEVALKSEGEQPLLVPNVEDFKKDNHKERMFFSSVSYLQGDTFHRLLLSLHERAQEIHSELESAKDKEKVGNGDKKLLRKQREEVQENVLNQLTNILKIVERTGWKNGNEKENSHAGKIKWNEIVGKNSIFYIENPNKKLNEKNEFFGDVGIKTTLKNNIEKFNPQFKKTIGRGSVVNIGFLSKSSSHASSPSDSSGSEMSNRSTPSPRGSSGSK